MGISPTIVDILSTISSVFIVFLCFGYTPNLIPVALLALIIENIARTDNEREHDK